MGVCVLWTNNIQAYVEITCLRTDKPYISNSDEEYTELQSKNVYLKINRYSARTQETYRLPITYFVALLFLRLTCLRAEQLFGLIYRPLAYEYYIKY